MPKVRLARQIAESRMERKLREKIAEREIQCEQAAKGAMRVAKVLRVVQAMHKRDMREAERLAEACEKAYSAGYLPEPVLDAVIQYRTARRAGVQAVIEAAA